MSIRRLQNGDLMVMSKDLGKDIPGYVQQSHNPNHYRQIMPPCIFREKKACGDCPRPVYKLVCSKERPLDCVECDEREE